VERRRGAEAARRKRERERESGAANNKGRTTLQLQQAAGPSRTCPDREQDAL